MVREGLNFSWILGFKRIFLEGDEGKVYKETKGDTTN